MTTTVDPDAELMVAVDDGQPSVRSAARLTIALRLVAETGDADYFPDAVFYLADGIRFEPVTVTQKTGPYNENDYATVEVTFRTRDEVLCVTHYRLDGRA